jgi:hypothetical protein
MDITSGSKTVVDNLRLSAAVDYQQRHICSDSEIITDDSLELLSLSL